MKRRFLTSESVMKGHPDKLCDLISDSILDECLNGDEMSRVAVETMATNGHVIIAGEVTTKAKVDYGKIAREVIKDVGYNEDYEISVYVHTQSPDIAGGVDNALETREEKDNKDLGAGDQGTVFGFAVNETEELMPMPLTLSHRICRTIDEKIKNGSLKGFGPDGKCQVTVEYLGERPIRVDSVIISVQHSADKDYDELVKEIYDEVITPVFVVLPLDEYTKVYINPSGRFVEGGPGADTGLTGRKIIVDTYGGFASHGGGAFSGKDPTKVDRSGAYMARLIAKTIVKAGIARKCQVAISYAIGKAAPTAVDINTFNTGIVTEGKLRKAVKSVFNLKPGAIIETLNLRSPIYKCTSSYGHFGDKDVPWETLDYTEELMEAINGNY